MDVPVFVWMFLVLKIPIIAALLLIWYAVQEPRPMPTTDGDDGGSRVPEAPRPRPDRPRRPRRDPHGAAPGPAPKRVRTARARRGRRPAGR